MCYGFQMPHPLARISLLVAAAACAAAACSAAPSRDRPTQAAPAPFWALAGTYGSSLGTPITFQQLGGRAVARFNRNGELTCAWHTSGVYLCSWRTDTASGLARIWWQGDRPAGHYGTGSSPDNGGRLDFWRMATSTGRPPATATTSVVSTTEASGGCGSANTPPAFGSGGPTSCNYNSSCPEDERCLNGRCAPSLGTKCGVSSDCSRIGNKFDCKSSGPHKMDGVCTAR
jgi:hypothetical protein